MVDATDGWINTWGKEKNTSIETVALAALPPLIPYWSPSKRMDFFIINLLLTWELNAIYFFLKIVK